MSFIKTANIKQRLADILTYIRNTNVANIITILLIAAILVCSVVTYAAITNLGFFNFGFEPTFESNLLLINLGLLLLLAVIVSRKLIHLYIARKKGRVGSRLLMRLVIISSIIAIIPSIVVALSSSFYLNLGIKSWFDERVSSAVVESVAVADAYLKEHSEIVRSDALSIASDITNRNLFIGTNQAELESYLNFQTSRKLLAEIIIFRKTRYGFEVIANSSFSFALDPLSKVRKEKITAADNGEISLISDETDHKVSALIKLNNYDDRYLLVSRFIDSKVLEHTDNAKGAAEEYLKLKRQIANFQVKSTIFFVFISLFMLLGAIWVAFKFANNLVAPITNLVAATDKMKKGEFTVRVKEGPENDEIGILARSFNQMAEEMESQKHNLMRANMDSEERAAFTETVLSGVSSGIMAIDIDRKIVTLNRSAMELLGLNKSAIGKKLHGVAEEFEELLVEALDKKTLEQQKQISLRRKQKRMNFMVRITPQTNRKTIEGYVFTFDDITELLSAQRHAAWSDVARKIAHEIKNPLTPINLSAQRIAKKYKQYMPEDELENFEGYTSTIARHTADIAKIITEFSDFAKLPAPKFAKCDLAQILKDSVFSSRVSCPDINIELDMPDSMQTVADPIQITQVFTNIIKNAAESITEKGKTDGKIMVIAQISKAIEIYIDDNGGGFPEELLDRLTEPYVTTRIKGTGLGLAIVKKIIEDHNGKIELSNIKLGARVKITLPII